ncbi:hypothetical protein M9H77_02582 [Catharanthus roseus]|uniref:Uncharacterized protein n=1 Tax=Catharanthus roseus TaxID=4058 RepID=A0ACC0C902_CATRO|nr:hypothetical protein M9H77_02582 [Catharanthus roseus]
MYVWNLDFLNYGFDGIKIEKIEYFRSQFGTCSLLSYRLLPKSQHGYPKTFMMDCGLSGMTWSIMPAFSVGCSGLTSLTRSFMKSFMFIERGTRSRASSSMSDLDKFCKLKEQKEHEHRTTGTPMPTDHELMLELNEWLKKGHAYGFSAVESTRLHAQSLHAIISSRPFLGGYEEHMAAISCQMSSLELPPEWWVPNHEIGEISSHSDQTTRMRVPGMRRSLLLAIIETNVENMLVGSHSQAWEIPVSR